MRAGDPEALGFHLDRGRVHLTDESTVADAMFEAWVADTAAGKSSLMLAYANEVVTDLNARAHRLATQDAGGTGQSGTAESDTASGDETGEQEQAEKQQAEKQQQDGAEKGGRWCWCRG